MMHQFLEPFQAYVSDLEGKVALIGFGVGEMIKVVETPNRHPMGTSLHYYLDKDLPIPLNDGSTIVKYERWPKMQWLYFKDSYEERELLCRLK